MYNRPVRVSESKNTTPNINGSSDGGIIEWKISTVDDQSINVPANLVGGTAPGTVVMATSIPDKKTAYDDFSWKVKELTMQVNTLSRKIDLFIKSFEECGYDEDERFGVNLNFELADGVPDMLKNVEDGIKNLQLILVSKQNLISETKTKFSHSGIGIEKIQDLNDAFDKAYAECHEKYSTILKKFEPAQKKIWDTSDYTHTDDYDDDDVADKTYWEKFLKGDIESGLSEETETEKKLKRNIDAGLIKFNAAISNKNSAEAETYRHRLVIDYGWLAEEYEKHAAELEERALLVETAAVQGNFGHTSLRAKQLAYAEQLENASAKYAEEAKLAILWTVKLGN
ncbi:MAG: hypothetical protein LBB18_00165 [Puniceicoccales bacterium]|jgi:hypothetical protein|nr:hypothetical protein [Puniceicoccales bacterium]